VPVNVGPGSGFAGATDDPVADWKDMVRERLRDEALVRAGRPPLRITISVGLIALVTLIGLTSGGWGLLTSVPLVLTALLAQEVPRAVLARQFGRSSRIVIGPSGAETQIAGEPMRGLPAFWPGTHLHNPYAKRPRFRAAEMRPGVRFQVKP
jgi:hypothetical protein